MSHCYVNVSRITRPEASIATLAIVADPANLNAGELQHRIDAGCPRRASVSS